VGHVVESLPSLAALIPLADQPRPNALAKVSRLKKVLNQYHGNLKVKEKNNGKEKENIL
jgi:hypothetical protein